MSDKLSMDQYADESGNALRQANTTITLTPKMFEKLYLSPKTPIHGDLRQTFGNPTPIALIGLCLSLSPLSTELMGWRGAGGLSANIGASYFFGGLLLILSGIGEFILGNTFPCCVFMGYGAHSLAFAATFTPSFAAISAYTTDGSQTQTPPFLASYGFYALFMCILSFVYLICSIRTNAVFFLVFASLTLGFGIAAGAFWHLAGGAVEVGSQLLVGTGACFFVTALAGWYLMLAIMLAAVDMPFSVPVFDLSTVIKGGSERRKAKGE